MRMTSRSVLSGFALVTALAFSHPASAKPATKCQAKYIGKLQLSPDSNGRSMTLLAPFAFQDGNCEIWKVPKDAAVDGASIPRIFWPLIGSPWTGTYRDASVIHDWYCAVRTKPWRDVHRNFFNAMLTSGVGQIQAKVMYLAVYRWGPRWDDLTIRNSKLLEAAKRRVSANVFQNVYAGQASLGMGDLAKSIDFLGSAQTQMQTNGDQYAVASLARSVAVAKSDAVGAGTAIDAMIASQVPDSETLESLHLDRARLAFQSRDFEIAYRNLQDTLRLNYENQDAVELFSSVERAWENSAESNGGTDSSEPSAIEFQRLKNQVEAKDLSIEEIEKLVDEIRPTP